MPTLLTRYYQTKNDFDVIFNRIQIDAEAVDVLVDQWFGGRTDDTSKPRVGRMDRSAGTFELVQTNAVAILPLRYLEGNFFTIFIKGYISRNTDKCKIEVRYRIGWFDFMFYLLLYTTAICLGIRFVLQEEGEKLTGLFPFISLFLLLPTILLVVQLKRVQRQMEALLGISKVLRDQ